MRCSRAAPWLSSAAASSPYRRARNQAEAEYRYVLTRLSENGESIAVLGGEEQERSAVDRSLTTVLRRWREICFLTMRTTIVSQTSVGAHGDWPEGPHRHWFEGLQRPDNHLHPYRQF